MPAKLRQRRRRQVLMLSLLFIAGIICLFPAPDVSITTAKANVVAATVADLG